MIDKNRFNFICNVLDASYYKDIDKFSITGWQIPTTETAVAIEVPKGVSVSPLMSVTGGAGANVSISISIRGIERNWQDFNTTNITDSFYNSEIGVYFSNNAFDCRPDSYKFIKFNTTTNSELYFQRKGGYLSSGFYSTRQVYGFIDYTV